MHVTAEDFMGANGWLPDLIRKFRSRLSCKCPAGMSMSDDEFARKFFPQGFINMMAGGAFFGETGKGDFSEQCPAMHTLWDLLTDAGMKDFQFGLPSTCTYSSYQSEVKMHISKIRTPIIFGQLFFVKVVVGCPSDFYFVSIRAAKSNLRLLRICPICKSLPP